MKYEISGKVFFGSGLILLLSFFLGLVPILIGVGSGAVILFPFFFPAFLLGVLDIICGRLNFIKQKAYEHRSIGFGFFSLILGFLYIFLFMILWWLVLVLFISGTILLYLGFTKSWK